ncbi:MAG: hypothetical protein JWM78_2837 [Verrucomicrobiaceae bacterium]|nr:hypothetical protein [Verrucomicrobiaceae bacterium]
MSGIDRDLPTADALFEHAACGLLVTANDGLVIRANATFCTWVGCSAEDIVGKRMFPSFLTMGGRVFQQTHWQPLLHMQGSVAEVKVDLVHSDGRTLPMMINVVRRQHGSVFMTEMALVIVTDRQKYERELLAARRKAEQALIERAYAEEKLHETNAQLSKTDQRKDEFLATLAHELRNPLAPIGNVVEILRAKDSNDSELQWARDVLECQLTQITHLVDDLLEISRITQGKLELRKEHLDLSAAMLAAMESAGPLVRRQAHELIVNLPAAPIRLDADPTRLTQMLLNLLNNAAKYTPVGGKIWLSAERQGSEAVLTVRDSGIGIAAEHLDSVFDMFSQLAPALERSQGGLGVGLALVRGLVTLHAGTISARSEGFGKGSTFEIRLPLLDVQAEAAKVAVKTSAVKTAGLRILVVDDNEDAIATLAMLLRMQGHTVEVAIDGAAALQQAEAFIPQLVLLDIGLPVMNGYEVARHIRREAWGQNMVLVALTGWGQADDKLKATEAGFDHHLTKPIDFDSLRAILRAV